MDSATSVERVRYRFLGHVQHRGFRFACVMCAEREHMTGWVRNERNGTVSAEVQGTLQGQVGFVRRLTVMVPGFGNDWSVGTERRIDLVEGETDFRVRRY